MGGLGLLPLRWLSSGTSSRFSAEFPPAMQAVPSPFDGFFLTTFLFQCSGDHSGGKGHVYAVKSILVLLRVNLGLRFEILCTF